MGKQQKLKQIRRLERQQMREMKEKPLGKDMIRVLAWCDTPTCSTGFATVSRNILTALVKTGKYIVDIIGINETGDFYDPILYPFRIFPAKSGITGTTDFHGRPRFISTIIGQDKVIRPPWDIIFTLNDPYILEQKVDVFDKGTLEVVKETQEVFKKKFPPEYWFKVISYWPIDSVCKGNWVEKSINLADVPVAYTQYGYDEIMKGNRTLKTPTDIDKKLQIIYHGVDTKIFKPVPKETVAEFREKFFREKIRKETFVITAIARNQMRKDLPRTLGVFAEFNKRRPDSFLYLHCQESDSWGSLKEYARNWENLEYGKNWGVPKDFNAHGGFPVEALNLLYNASDCILSTTLGEGFGFYNLEGFATKTLVVAPNNTTHPELFGYDKNEDISDIDAIADKLRGIPFKCGSSPTEWVAFGMDDLERIRPITNVEDAVKKLMWAYDNPAKVEEIENRAYEWVQQYDWSKITPQWDKIFVDTFKELEYERSQYKPDPTQKTEGKPSEPERNERGVVQEVAGEHKEDKAIPGDNSKT